MGSLHFDITGDNSNLMNTLSETQRGIKDTARSVEQSGVGIEDMFSKISKAAAGLGIAFSAQQFASQVMRIRGEFQQLEVAFTTMLGSAEKANDLMAQLTRTAAITPFGLQDVAGGAKSLLAYGVASEKVNETLIRLGDIAAGLSIPLNDLVYLYGTTMTQGRMFTQDLRQFQGRGIPLADELAKQFGVTKDKVGELVTAGKVGFTELERAIISMTSKGSKFGGLMEAQSKTITGQISNIEDAIDGMFNTIGQSSEGIINLALGGVFSLVENWQKVGEAISVMVGAYGAYRTALAVGIALQKVENAIVAETAVQKGLAAMAGHALTAEQARGAAVAVLYANAQRLVATSLMAVAKATVLNPYVLAAAAITGVAYGVYKLATAESKAVEEQERFNNELEKHNKESEEYKNNIDDLVDSLGKLELSESTRIRNFAKLKSEYGDILENIKNENDFLREKESIIKKINEQQSREHQEVLKTQLAREQDLALLYEKAIKFGDISVFTKSDYEERLEGVNNNIKTLKKDIAEVEIDKFLSGLENLDSKELTSVFDEVTLILQSLEGANDNAIGLVGGISNDVFEFTKSQLKDLKNAISGEISARGGEKKTASQWLAQYKAEYDAAQKALTEYKLKRDKISEAEYERGLKTLNDNLAAAKKKYEDAGGSLKSHENAIKAEEERKKELLSIQRRNTQDEIDTIRDNSEKKRAQIELDYQKDLDAYEEAKKKYGEVDEVKQMKETIDLKHERALTEWKKESLKEELQAEYDYLQEYGTIQQQKYAIAKQYDDMIAEERNKHKKQALEKEKQSKLASMDANNIAMGIDWGLTFKGIGNVLGDIAKETLSKVEEYMKTNEFKELDAENKKTYTDLRDKLRQETGEGATSPFNFKQWDEISKDVENYKKAVGKLKDAQTAHNEAVNRLKKAEEAFVNATDDTSKAIAKTAVDIAKEDVEVTGSNQAEAEDNVNTSKNNLVKSTNEAAQGIENFASYLNEMNSGSLYGFANGITKLITSLTKGSDGVGKSLEQLGGKVGGIIGAILQIIEVLGDAPEQFIDELLTSVAVAVERVLVELPQIIGSIIEGVGNIVSSIFTGIGSWFGFGSGDKKHEKRIKNYQKEIDKLNKRYEKLEEEVEKSYSTVAKSKIEEQNKMLEQQRLLIQNQIKEEEAKKNTDKDKIKEWKEEIEEINKTIAENQEAAKDAIFGSDLQSAIEDFASAYIEAWSAGEDKAKSAKDVVRNMIKGMITESIKAAASDPMKAIREKLLKFWSDEYIDAWEESQLNQAAEQLQKDLDERFGWADRFMDDTEYTQEASSKGFETMNQDTAEELNGRFTALQISNEEIKNQMIQSVVLYTQMLSLTSQSNGLLSDILAQHAISNGYLSDIAKYSKMMTSYGQKIDKIIENTQNL